MGKHFWLLPVAAAGLLLAACGTHVMHKGCTLDGHTSMTEYDMAYLTDLQRQRLDSTVLTDGKFSFEVADSVAQPFALIVQLVDNEQADALLEMPLMVENGHISLEIGLQRRTGRTERHYTSRDRHQHVQILQATDSFKQEQCIGTLHLS